VHYFELGAPLTLHLNPAQVYVFDASGDLVCTGACRRDARGL
jgi:glycerol transport system ATP-binding protein